MKAAKQMKTMPNITQLVRCSELLARCLSVEPAPESSVREVIDEILFTRGNFECAQRGILTRHELRDLLLAHFCTRLYDESAPPGVGREPWRDEELNRCVKAALFGA
jgi:hypothetical protein